MFFLNSIEENIKVYELSIVSILTVHLKFISATKNMIDIDDFIDDKMKTIYNVLLKYEIIAITEDDPTWRLLVHDMSEATGDDLKTCIDLVLRWQCQHCDDIDDMNILLNDIYKHRNLIAELKKSSKTNKEEMTDEDYEKMFDNIITEYENTVQIGFEKAINQFKSVLKESKRIVTNDRKRNNTSSH